MGKIQIAVSKAGFMKSSDEISEFVNKFAFILNIFKRAAIEKIRQLFLNPVSGADLF